MYYVLKLHINSLENYFRGQIRDARINICVGDRLINRSRLLVRQFTGSSEMYASTERRYVPQFDPLKSFPRLLIYCFL
jgi:hypothetical protein